MDRSRNAVKSVFRWGWYMYKEQLIKPYSAKHSALFQSKGRRQSSKQIPPFGFAEKFSTQLADTYINLWLFWHCWSLSYWYIYRVELFHVRAYIHLILSWWSSPQDVAMHLCIVHCVALHLWVAYGMVRVWSNKKNKVDKCVSISCYHP